MLTWRRPEIDTVLNSVKFDSSAKVDRQKYFHRGGPDESTINFVSTIDHSVMTSLAKAESPAIEESILALNQEITERNKMAATGSLAVVNDETKRMRTSGLTNVKGKYRVSPRMCKGSPRLNK